MCWDEHKKKRIESLTSTHKKQTRTTILSHERKGLPSEKVASVESSRRPLTPNPNNGLCELASVTMSDAN